MDYRLPIWTDGSYRAETNTGGWGFTARLSTNEFVNGSGGVHPGRSSMRMELQAMISAIEAFPDDALKIWTDHQGFAEKFSQGPAEIKQWLNRFAPKHPRNSTRLLRGHDHYDLLVILADYRVEREVEFGFVKGHSKANVENNVAHCLANKGRKKAEFEYQSGRTEQQRRLDLVQVSQASRRAAPVSQYETWIKKPKGDLLEFYSYSAART